MIRQLARACLLAACLAAGCSEGLRPEQLQPWVGRPAAALEKEWGPPTRQVEDQGLRLLIYEEVARRTTADFQRESEARQARGTYGLAQATANQYAYGPAVYVRSYLFWVDARGAIVRVDMREP